MKFAIGLVALSMGALFSILYAKEDIESEAVAQGSIPKAFLEGLSHQVAYLRTLDEFSFCSTLVYYRNPARCSAGSLDGPQVGHFNYAKNGEKYLIEDSAATGPEAQSFYSKIAFDGAVYQRYHLEKSFLFVKSISSAIDMPSEAFLRDRNFFFQIFEFLSDKLFHSDMADLQLADLAHDTSLLALKRRIIDITSLKDGDMSLKIDGGVERFTQLPSLYVVKLSKADSFLPVEWRRVDRESGNPICQLEVVKWHHPNEGGKLIPAAVLYKFYGGGRSAFPYDVTPVYSVKIEFSDWLEKVPASAGYSIDPAIANTILDANENVFIEVPR